MSKRKQLQVLFDDLNAKLLSDKSKSSQYDFPGKRIATYKLEPNKMSACEVIQYNTLRSLLNVYQVSSNVLELATNLLECQDLRSLQDLGKTSGKKYRDESDVGRFMIRFSAKTELPTLNATIYRMNKDIEKAMETSPESLLSPK